METSDIRICPCCKETFDNNKINFNNDVYGDIVCIPCFEECIDGGFDWQQDC